MHISVSETPPHRPYSSYRRLEPSEPPATQPRRRLSVRPRPNGHPVLTADQSPRNLQPQASEEAASHTPPKRPFSSYRRPEPSEPPATQPQKRLPVRPRPNVHSVLTADQTPASLPPHSLRRGSMLRAITLMLPTAAEGDGSAHPNE
jgi:hypothetical protein